ncbi:hypothetical protein HYH03_014002 [Edaphochlamys debaryana]|uniref:AAA+ ATPase domain-containing protein n=1 Tax=Edaphochlamys debaryana TaxID=47281 RepID=A0A836BSN6_9CHLO|nr:hypothetical protein HYH03_014002 [Edaphochlamys debaryana]|eukprot:KAG2487435.1 hypothetical protein HYH03_014002 [Edaphochlamys debaryana]
MRLLAAGIHDKACKELAGRMAALGEQVMTLVAVDTNARLQEVQDVVVAAKALLDRVALGQDPSAEVCALVEQTAGWQRWWPWGSWSRRLFWGKFPRELEQTLPDDAQAVKEICALLAEEGRREALQRALEQYHPPEQLSVWELHMAFNGDEALLPQIRRLVDGEGLPPLPRHYAGREEEAKALTEALQKRSLLLHGPAGFGKSSLAADVAAQLMRSGAMASRALWVDLREAGSAEEVEARFSAALGVQMENPQQVTKCNAAARILAALRGLAEKAGGDGGSSSSAVAVVVVVDNAEDALVQPAAAEALRGVVQKVLAEAPTVRLLLTSRIPLGGGLAVTERHVGPMSPDMAARVIQAAALDLTIDQAARVAAACRYVPLVLNLVAEALAFERLTLKVRRALHKEALAYLAVFPSAFDVGAAAAVFDFEQNHPKPHEVLSVLHQYGVLQRADRQQRYIMHMLVWEHVAKLGAPGDDTFQHRAEGRFVRHMLSLLRDWADDWKRHSTLALAQAQQADLGLLFELLQGLTLEHGVDVAAAALDLTDKVADLLAALGLLQQMRGPCEALLAQLESAGPGAAELPPDVEKAVASVLYMLGVVHLTDKRYAGAEAATQRSLDLRRHALGPEHCDTIALMSSLASCLQARGRYEGAEPLYCQALELRQRILGPEDPDTIASMGDLAGFLKIRGQYAEAEPRFRLALELGQRVLGLEHQETINTIKSLAGCLQARAGLDLQPATGSGCDDGGKLRQRGLSEDQRRQLEEAETLWYKSG